MSNKYLDEIIEKYSNKIIQERTKNLKTIREEQKHSISEEFICFSLTDSQKYAISFNFIYKVLENFNLTTVPFMPRYIKGIINYRGEILSVISLSDFLLNELSDDLPKNLVILTINKIKIGVLIDCIYGIQRYEKDKFKKPFYSKNIKKMEFITSIYDNDTLVLNIENILLDNELGISDIKQE